MSMTEEDLRKALDEAYWKGRSDESVKTEQSVKMQEVKNNHADDCVKKMFTQEDGKS